MNCIKSEELSIYQSLELLISTVNINPLKQCSRRHKKRRKVCADFCIGKPRFNRAVKSIRHQSSITTRDDDFVVQPIISILKLCTIRFDNAGHSCAGKRPETPLFNYSFVSRWRQGYFPGREQSYNIDSVKPRTIGVTMRYALAVFIGRHCAL